MKLRITWKEFEQYALEKISAENPLLSDGGYAKELRYIRTYGHEPEGDHYEFPDFIEIEILNNKNN